MGRLVDAILNLSGPTAYGLVGLLAFGEAAAFIGLVLPGELAVLLGGVIASSGNVSLPVMIVVASVAAIAGDSAGYEVGRHFGTRILAWPPFHRRFAAKVAHATTYLNAKGGRAVFLGRWTSLLRALIPGIAGVARMPYGRFLAFNVVGGVAWATTFVMLGYLAGASWRRVERIAGQASLILLVLVVLAVVLRWATRHLLARTDALRVRLDTAAAWPATRWAARRFAAPLSWVRTRTTPGPARGLGWTLSVVVAGAGAWVAGIAVQDLFAREELVLLDRPVATWIAMHTTPEATRIAESVVDIVSAPWGVWAVLVLAAIAARWAGRAAGVRVGVAALLAAALAAVLQSILPTSVAGTPFPARSVTWLTAATVAAVPAIATRHLRVAVRVAGASAGMLLVAAMAELVAGDATLTGIVGAIGVGGLVGIGGELTARTIAPPSHDPTSAVNT